MHSLAYWWIYKIHVEVVFLCSLSRSQQLISFRRRHSCSVAFFIRCRVKLSWLFPALVLVRELAKASEDCTLNYDSHTSSAVSKCCRWWRRLQHRRGCLALTDNSYQFLQIQFRIILIPIPIRCTKWTLNTVLAVLITIFITIFLMLVNAQFYYIIIVWISQVNC